MRVLVKATPAIVGFAAALYPALALAGFVAPTPVPEPGTLGMFAAGIGAAVVALRFWRR